MTKFLSVLIVSMGLSLAAQAAGYYDQFLFSVEGDCQNINKIWFHSASSYGSIPLGLDSQGRPMEASLVVQLFPDQTYWVDYLEIVITGTDGHGGRFYDLVFERKQTGTWKTNGDELVL